MRDTFVYLLQNLLIIDLVVLTLWILDKKFSGKMGHLWRKILWLIICIRMVIPVEIQLQDIKENWTGVQIELEVEVNEKPVVSAKQETTTKVDSVQIYEPVTSEESDISGKDSLDTTVTLEKRKTIREIWTEYWGIILAVIWLIGFGISLFYHIFQYYLVKEFYFEEATECNDERIFALLNKNCKKHHIRNCPQLLEKDGAATPMTFGYVRRKLVYPPNIYNEEEMSLILQHELVHLKLWDSWYKTFLLIVCDLYWFNPIFLLMKHMAYQDVEYVCDEYVTKKMNDEEKQSYGTAILKTVVGKSEKGVPSMVQFAVSKKRLKSRLHNLFEFRNWYLGIVPLLFTFIVMSAFIMGISFSIKEVPVSAAGDVIVTVEDMRDSVAGTYYTDSLDAISNQKDLESCYVTDRFTGWNHYYIDTDGVLWGTGGNNLWQLGIADENDRGSYEAEYSEPVKIAEHVIHVDANVNSEFVIWLTADGDLYGLGANLCGILRMPVVPNEKFNPDLNLAPEPQLLMTDVAFASAGQTCISVLTKDGKVWWWGEMSATTGTSGAGLMYSEEPKLMLENARYTVCDGHTAAAIDQNNNLWLWGCNVWGQCGKDGIDYVAEPYMACSDVEMVWVDLLSSKQNVYDVEQWKGMNPYSLTTEENVVDYTYTTFVRKTDGKMYACGIDLGHYVKSVALFGDIYISGAEQPENYTRDYSPYFLLISVEEIQTREPKWKL